MLKLKIHWVNKFNSHGSFIVNANSIKECLDIANEEIGSNARVTEWYPV